MTSDSFIKDQLSKVKSIFPNPLSFRQTGSVTTQGEGSQFSVKQTHPFKTLSRSSTINLLAIGSAEPKNDQGAGHTLSPGDPSPSTQPRTVNVVLFGETGVGKSSVINLIARKEVAKVSSDVNGCTMQSTRYDIPFDDMSFAIFDTIGLEEPQMGINGYLKAIERAYELIVKLGAAGGIHLLLFCMRGGRITATTQSNYRLFCECLCNTKVPIALVFTGLEREVEMEDWWTRNKTHIEHYGIKSDGHACITAVQDEAPGEDLKYMESQKRIRELLKTCALKNEAFLPEPHTWFAKLGKGMRSFIEKHRNPKRRDVMRVLTHRCKLDPETARKIADMMEKGDTETKEGNQGEQVGSKEGEGGSNPVVGKDENELVKNIAAKSDAPPNQHGDVKAEPRNDALEGLDDGLAKMNAARDKALAIQHGGVKTEPRNDAPEGLDGGRAKMNVARDHALAIQHAGVKAEPRHDTLEGLDGERVKMNVARDDALAIQHGRVKAEPHNDALEVLDGGRPKMNVARDGAPVIQHGRVKAEPRHDALEGLDGGRPKINAARDGAPVIQHGRVKAEPRHDALEGLDGGRPKINAARDGAPVIQHGRVKTEPRHDALEGLDGGRPKINVARDDAPAIQHGRVKAEPRNDAPEGLDTGRPKMNVARDGAPVIQHGRVKVEPRNDALEGLDGGRPKVDVARDNALAIWHGDVEAEPCTDALEGLDSGPPKMNENDGDQLDSLNAVAVEQAKSKRDDSKKKPEVPLKVPLQSSGSWQVISPSRGSQP